MKPRPPLLDPIFVAMAAGIFAADQLTKRWVAVALGPAAGRHVLDVVGDVVRIGYTTNTGAAFGIGQNRSFVFTLVALIAIPAILLFNRSITPRTLLTRI